MARQRPSPPRSFIQTLTVGSGVSPDQPIAGCNRVADFNRRFGITPTPGTLHSYFATDSASILRDSTISAGLGELNTALPATKVSAPASAAISIVFILIPPST